MNKYSGKFVLRISHTLHEALKNQAQAKGISLNQICQNILAAHIKAARDKQLKERLDQFIEQAQLVWSSNLVGIVLFGSQAREDTYSTSDVDLLLVIKGIPVSRNLYRQWDELIDDNDTPQVNPHFVALPQDEKLAGSLWLEVAHEGILMWESNKIVSSLMLKIKNTIKKNKFKKAHAHGHAYWVRENYA